MNKTSSRWSSTLQTESPRKMLNKRWQVSSDSSGASYDKYNVYNSIGEGQSGNRKNGKGDNLQEGLFTTPPRSLPSTYFFFTADSSGALYQNESKAASQSGPLSNPRRKFMHSKYGKILLSHHPSLGNLDH